MKANQLTDLWESPRGLVTETWKGQFANLSFNIEHKIYFLLRLVDEMKRYVFK